ncbi:MAG TPA: hypothetical protein VMY37_13210 [Thermoguttaceae bacterium]|nr:hypothetical protein [Thermoguttaceae bacterium]
MALNLFSGLRRVAEIFYVRLFGEQINTEHLDADQLKQAYREVANLRPLVDTIAAFVLAGGITAESEDEDAAETLKNFLRLNMGALRRSCRESCLYGYTWLMPYWSPSKNAARLRVYSPEAVKLRYSEDDPDEVAEAVITSTRVNITRRQTITATTWKIEVTGKPTTSGTNPLGLIPVFPVHINRFSDDEFGSSVISDALYQTLREKAVLRSKGISVERRQSSILAVSGGRADVIKPKLESADADKPTIPALYLPDPKATVSFVESRRGPEGVIELLKMLYHDVIVDSISEYALGVGMPSAQASTREQRIKIEAVVNPLRDDWLEPLELLMTLVLRLHEVHEVRRFADLETEISFGPLFEKDAVAEADTLQRKSAALATLNTLGMVSRETAQEALPEIIPDTEREKERLDAERAEAEPYRNPQPEPPNPRTPEPDTEEPAEEPGWD